MYYDCWHCGKSFSEAEALAANTTEPNKKMFCSRVCEDMNKEELERDIKDAEATNLLIEQQQKEKTDAIRAEIAGFNLKIKGIQQ